MKAGYLLVCLIMVHALVSSEEVVREETYTVNATESGSVTVSVGSVTDVRLSQVAPSGNWAGIYGNASAAVQVGGNRSLFSWPTGGGARYVYLDENGINFTSDWKPGNRSLMAKEYPFLENSTEDVSTFNASVKINSTFQESALTTVGVRTNDGTGHRVWETGYLYEGSDGFFAGVVRENGTAFSGGPADYQVMVPENAEDDEPTSFGVWVEISG